MSPGENVTRRDVLGLVAGGGTAALAGCGGPLSCGASGPRMKDDILRVEIDQIEAVGDGFRWDAGVWQPGSDTRPERSREFNSSYDDVAFHAFDIGGNEIEHQEFGSFEPGYRESYTATTSEFPHLITATVASHSGSYDGRCTQAAAGADVCVYVGHHPDGVRLEYPVYNPEPTNWRRRADSLGGQVWSPFDILLAGESSLPQGASTAIPCFQRMAAGNPPDFDAFRLVPDPTWLERSERYTLRVGDDPSRSEDVEPPPHADSVPEWVEFTRDQNGNLQLSAGSSNDPSVRELTRAEFEQLYAAFEGMDQPTTPDPYCGHDDSTYLTCSNHSRGHCAPGRITATYQTEVSDTNETASLRLIYEWDGIQE